MNAEKLASALGGRRTEKGWIAHCPAHDDQTPSLSIKYSDSGKVLVHCHAGCSNLEVIDSLRQRGLWHLADETRQGKPKSAAPGPAHPLADNWDPLPSDSDTRLAASSYCHRGWSPIPIPQRTKAPVEEGWPAKRLNAEQAERECSPTGNVGIILGAASSGLVDIDLDAPEAVNLADRFLPPTTSVFGRRGKPRSHRLYRGPLDQQTAKFQDPTDKVMLLELRANGGLQTVFPPSIHPSGERVVWDNDGQPAPISAEALHQAVARLAVACLVVRHGQGGDEVFDLPPEQWLDALADAPEAVRRLAKEWLKQNDWPPLVRLDHPILPRLRGDALPSWAGDFATATSAATETPPELAVGLVLSTCATAVARRFRVMVKYGYFEPCNLWLAVALEPGNRKSAVQGAATAPLVGWERKQKQAMADEITKATSALKTAEARAKQLRADAAKERDEAKSRKCAQEAADIEANMPQVPRPPAAVDQRRDPRAPRHNPRRQR
jgi:hypothetical protein